MPQSSVRDINGYLLVALLCFVMATLAGCGGKEVSSRRVPGKKAGLPPGRLAHELKSDIKQAFNRESYDHIVENEYLDALSNPQSTFSIDVDTASYANVRRIIDSNKRPPRGAVRIEEFINYFDYQYPQPADEHPFSVSLDVASCPWNADHELLRVALKGKEFKKKERPPANLVYLLDVSGSMSGDNRLPLVKKAMKMLVKKLNKRDRVAIVVYAGSSGIALPSTSVANKKTILKAINSLNAGGSTNGSEGISLAYQVAVDHFIEGGTNRVILCSDGDFNVGTTNQSDLVDLIQEKAKSDVFLSVFGFGMGNYQDSTMEKLANQGNGNYGYIDSLDEAKKTFVRDTAENMITIAKDVKIQVDFNPSHVSSYRLIGYENRMLENEDFADDSKDAGEIGAGHTVTAFYELVPAGVESPAKIAKGSKFVTSVVSEEHSDTKLTVALRYKLPDEDASIGTEVTFENDSTKKFELMPSDFQFAASVAAFGMLLRDSEFAGSATFGWVLDTAKQNVGDDPEQIRTEFVKLVRKAKLMNGKVEKRLSYNSKSH